VHRKAQQRAATNNHHSGIFIEKLRKVANSPRRIECKISDIQARDIKSPEGYRYAKIFGVWKTAWKYSRDIIK
jgi:hypothetical protein